MGPCCGSRIALTPEHEGRGTPAISGGAEFFSLDILPSERESVSKKCFFEKVLGSNPTLCTKIMVMGSIPTFGNYEKT